MDTTNPERTEALINMIERTHFEKAAAMTAVFQLDAAERQATALEHIAAALYLIHAGPLANLCDYAERLTLATEAAAAYLLDPDELEPAPPLRLIAERLESFSNAFERHWNLE